MAYSPKKIKVCKYCRSEIDSKAKICPRCQKKQGSGCGCAAAVLIGIVVLGGFMVFSGACSGFMQGYNNAKVQQEAGQYSEVDYKAACRAVTYEDIARDKEGLKGEKVTFTGEIIQASSGTYRLNVTKTTYGYTDTILFTINESALNQKILEDDIVTIWGESAGMYTYKAVLGNEVTVPKIQAIYIEDFGKSKE